MRTSIDEVKRAESELESLLKDAPRSTVETFDALEARGIKRHAARRAFSGLLYMKRIEYVSPNAVRLSKSRL